MDEEELSELHDFLEYLMPTFSKEYLNYPDVEEFLTLLDVAEAYSATANTKLTFPRRRLSRLRRTFLGKLARYLWTGHEHLPREHPIRLFVQALKAGDTVVTFNYDLTIEDAITDIKGLDWDYSPKDKSITLLKPHGSIDWFYADELEANQETETAELFQDLTQYMGWKYNEKLFGSKLAVIVPPVATKLIDLRDLQQVWIWVTNAVASAEEVFILGYSLPEADRLTRFVLRQAFQMRRSKGEIWVVNPDAGLRGRYQDWLSSDIRFVPQTFEWWAPRFSKQESAKQASAKQDSNKERSGTSG